MTHPQPFTPGFTGLCDEMQVEALIRQGLIPTVHPVTATVRQMDEDRLAILLRPGAPLTADDWAEIERNL